MDFKAATIIVSSESPNEILATEAGTENFVAELFGRSAEEVRGHSISILVTSQNDHFELCKAIERTSLLETTTIFIVLRSGHENSRKHAVTVSPFQDCEALLLACRLTVHTEDPAEHHGRGFQSLLISQPRALITADWPHAIAALSDGFAEHLGLPPAAGQPRNLGQLLALHAGSQAHLDQLISIVRRSGHPVHGALISPLPTDSLTDPGDPQAAQRARPITLLPLLRPLGRRPALVLIVLDPTVPDGEAGLAGSDGGRAHAAYGAPWRPDFGFPPSASHTADRGAPRARPSDAGPPGRPGQVEGMAQRLPVGP